MGSGQRLEVGADDELPFWEAHAALDDRVYQGEPERRFAALELDLDAVGVESVEAGEDRRQRVLAPVESGSVGIDPRYLAIAAAQIAAQCGHENEIIERSGGGETLRHRISVPRAAEDVVVVEHMPFVGEPRALLVAKGIGRKPLDRDRKSTRLNSSH